jgi:hypothetical protein
MVESEYGGPVLDIVRIGQPATRAFLETDYRATAHLPVNLGPLPARRRAQRCASAPADKGGLS